MKIPLKKGSNKSLFTGTLLWGAVPAISGDIMRYILCNVYIYIYNYISIYNPGCGGYTSTSGGY